MRKLVARRGMVRHVFLGNRKTSFGRRSPFLPFPRSGDCILFPGLSYASKRANVEPGCPVDRGYRGPGILPLAPDADGVLAQEIEIQVEPETRAIRKVKLVS